MMPTYQSAPGFTPRPMLYSWAAPVTLPADYPHFPDGAEVIVNTGVGITRCYERATVITTRLDEDGWPECLLQVEGIKQPIWWNPEDIVTGLDSVESLNAEEAMR